MKKNIISLDPAMKNGYIPAPYVLEDGEKINDIYLEPVLFCNQNGPTIGVTTCGVIVQDGLFFKDICKCDDLSIIWFIPVSADGLQELSKDTAVGNHSKIAGSGFGSCVHGSGKTGKAVFIAF